MLDLKFPETRELHIHSKNTLALCVSRRIRAKTRYTREPGNILYPVLSPLFLPVLSTILFRFFIFDERVRNSWFCEKPFYPSITKPSGFARSCSRQRLREIKSFFSIKKLDNRRANRFWCISSKIPRINYAF